MYVTVQGLVLRVTAYNDTDAILTLLTKEQGKLSVKARGLRRRNSPLTAPCQLLAYGEFVLFEYKGMYSINEAQSVELFRELRKDILKLSLGTYFVQVTDIISQEDQPNPQLLSLVLNSLYALAKLDLPAHQVKAVFELRSICLAGYTPDLSCCYRCGALLPDRFNISEGRLECAACRDVNSESIRLPISLGVLEGMRHCCYCDPKKLFAFSSSKETLLNMAQISESYLLTQLERGFSTLDFYKSLVLHDSISGEQNV